MIKHIFSLLFLLVSVCGFSQTDIPVSSMTGTVHSASVVSGQIYEVQVNSITDPNSIGDGTSIDASGDWVMWKDRKRYIVTSIDCGNCLIFSSTVIIQVTADNVSNGAPTLGVTPIFINETSSDLGSYMANVSDADRQAILSYYLKNNQTALNNGSGGSSTSSGVVDIVDPIITVSVGQAVIVKSASDVIPASQDSLQFYSKASAGLVQSINSDTVSVVISGPANIPNTYNTDSILYVGSTPGVLEEGKPSTGLIQNIGYALNGSTILVTNNFIGDFSSSSGGESEGGGSSNIHFAENKAQIGTLTTSAGDIILTSNEEKYLVVVDSLDGYPNDTMGVIQTASGGYAIAEDYELETFGFNLTDTLTDQTAFEKLIDFQFAKTNGALFHQEFKEGTCKIDTILFRGTTFDEIWMDGKGMKINPDKDTLYDYEVFSIRTDKCYINDFNINGFFDDPEVLTGDPRPTDLSGWTLNNVNRPVTNDTLFFLSGFSFANINDATIAVGKKYLVQIQVDAISGSTFFSIEDNPTVQLDIGLNTFEYEVTSPSSPARYELLASGAFTMTVSNVTIKEIEESPRIWIDNDVNSIVIDVENVTVDATHCVISNCVVNTGDMALRISSNPNGGFLSATMNGNDCYSRDGIQIVGLHDRVRITDNISKKHRRWDGEDGVKSIAYAYDAVETIHEVDVLLSGNVVQYGGDGSAYFLSGNTGRPIRMIDNEVWDFNYYIDSLGVFQGYGTTSHLGGNIIKIDPVVFNATQTYLIDGLNVSNSNDTLDRFQPYIFAANGAMNVTVQNSTTDLGQIVVEDDENPISGSFGGSVAARFTIDNVKFRVKSTNEQPNFPYNTTITNCEFQSNYALQGYSGDSTKYARPYEYIDSVRISNPRTVTCVSCDISDSRFYGVGLSVSSGTGGPWNDYTTNIRDLKFHGPGIINIDRDVTAPFIDTLVVNIDNVNTGIRVNFRSTDQNNGVNDTNTFVNVSNSSTEFITAGSTNTEAYFTTLPSGNFNIRNCFSKELFITEQSNGNYIYSKSLDKTPLYYPQTTIPNVYTTAQRTALTGIAEGLIVWDSDLVKCVVFDGAAWVNMDGTSL